MKTIEDRKIQMECILILGANLLWHKYNNIPMVQLVHFPQTCATVFTISVWVTKATCSKNSGHFLCKYFELILGSLSKPRRQRQRERHQTQGLMSRTMAVHVHYKSLYIS